MEGTTDVCSDDSEFINIIVTENNFLNGLISYADIFVNVQ